MAVKKNKTIQNACAEQELNKTNRLNIQEALWVVDMISIYSVTEHPLHPVYDYLIHFQEM